MTLDELRSQLEQSSGEPDPRRRRMKALAVLTARLAQDGIMPILVGGGAVEFYTAGGYATVDMVLALPVSDEVDAAFADLGFVKTGRFWLRDDLDLIFEAPAPAGLPGENAPRTVVDVDGMQVHIIGVDDLILDRLRAWVHWQQHGRRTLGKASGAVVQGADRLGLSAVPCRWYPERDCSHRCVVRRNAIASPCRTRTSTQRFEGASACTGPIFSRPSRRRGQSGGGRAIPRRKRCCCVWTRPGWCVSVADVAMSTKGKETCR